MIFIKPKPAVISGILLLLYVSALGDLSEIQAFDSKVTRSTFKLQSGNAIGTGFVLLQPDKTDTNRFGFVLITAAHVLVGMPSSNLTMFVRRKEGNSFRKQEHQLPIRAYGTNLWTQHPKADVAVMRIQFPSNADLGNLLTTLLATDKDFEEMAIHPGDELRVYGYPYGFEANATGFPILRSGKIASFPLTPSSEYPSYLLDFRVFRGNSGGPVYILENRQMERGSLNTVMISMLMGLISEQATISERLTGLTEEMVKTHELGLGIVIHPQLIRETIDLLPAMDAAKP